MNVKHTSLTPLVGTCLLTEIFTHNSNANTEQVFKKNFEKIFSALLLRIASTLDNQMPLTRNKDENETKPDAKSTKQAVNTEYKKIEPVKFESSLFFILNSQRIFFLLKCKPFRRVSIDCFKSFMKATKSDELSVFYENENVSTKLADSSSHVEACFALARSHCAGNGVKKF